MSRRNLKSNNREQIVILNKLAAIKPRWFYQRKQGEWESLTGEGGRYFKKVIGYSSKDFRPEPSKKRGRVIDNQEFAKAWLAFIGFPDWAGDRTAHFFEKDNVYRAAFMSSPSNEHWELIAKRFSLEKERENTLTESAGGRYQYLLAIGVWNYIKKFLPSPQLYRTQGLEEGHRDGKIQKSGGSFKGAAADHDAYLLTNTNYQVWRVMSNMKTLLVFAVAHVLANRYGRLDEDTCKKLIQSFDLAEFEHSGVISPSPADVREMTELPAAMVFGRIMHFLRHVVQQYWEDKRSTLLATPRLRLYLLRSAPMRDIGKVIGEANSRKSLDRGWKPGGVTFTESLPDADEPDQLKLA